VSRSPTEPTATERVKDPSSGELKPCQRLKTPVGECMKNLSESLATFNESFASVLYVMDMNTLTVD
ncbi:hypothetical protein B0H14DRAFT_2279387, partial [Mycena olivaceomarginata]